MDTEGWVNPCFFVEAEESWVVRCNARDPSLPKYQRDKIVFDLLKKNGLPVPEVVYLDDSKAVSSFDVLISSRVEGRNLESDWKELKIDQKEHLASKAGELLKKNHSIQFDFFGEISNKGPLPQTKSWFEYLKVKLDYHLSMWTIILEISFITMMRSERWLILNGH